MNKDNYTEKVVAIVEEILVSAGFSFESIHVEDDGIGIPRIHVLSEKDARFLIGFQGKHLESFSLLLRQMLEKKGLDDQFILDVNNYQKEKIDALKDTVKIHAERAKFFKKELPLPTMSAYERMIVHAIVQSLDGFSTESRGEGADRAVVIIPPKEIDSQ